MAQLDPHPVDIQRLTAAAREVCLALGMGDDAEVMANTPRRYAELWAEMVNPPWVDPEDVFTTFDNDYGYDDLVIINGVHYSGACAHHLAPFFGVGHFAYVPNKRIVGYSKVKKGLNYVARGGPQVNERILTTTLGIVQEQIQPRGCALVLQSVHCCIAVRSNGPAQEIVTTTGFKGCLRDAPYRSDFMRSVEAHKPLFLGA